jgi:hypothetical protein
MPSSPTSAPTSARAGWRRLADAAIAGVPVLDRRYIVETLTGRTPLGGLTPNEFGSLLPSRQYLVVRRVIELALTVLLLPVLLPVLLIVAAIVRWTVAARCSSCRPASVGAARPFRMIKFRTMFHGAGGRASRPPSIPRHPRRRLPAPVPARRAAAALQHPARRHELGRAATGGGVARAGLCARHRALRAARHRAAGRDRAGRRSTRAMRHAPDEMRSKLEYDLYYLKHCSLWLDLVIVLRTFAVVFRGTGAR